MAMEIDAKTVGKLREQSGARLMDCKKALIETSGDMEAAGAWLRQRNMAVGTATTKPSTEGKIGYVYENTDQSGQRLVVYELGSTTDFVANGREFNDLNALIGDVLDKSRATTLEEALRQSPIGLPGTLSEIISEFAGKVGENVCLKRVEVLTGPMGYYLHHDCKQMGVVQFEPNPEFSAFPAKVRPFDLGKDLSMHVVFAKPRYLSRADVPADEVAKITAEIADGLKVDPKNADKKPEIIEKMATGRLSKALSAMVMLEQPYFKENSKKVSDMLKPEGVEVKVTRFSFIQVGQ